MILTKQERDDPLWQKLKADYEARLAQLRKENDKDMSDLDTAKLRGRLAEVKRFLNIGEDKQIIDVE